MGLLATSCGGASSGPLVTEVARPVAAASGDGEAGPIDVSRPKDLVLLTRYRNPEETMDAVSTLSGTPLSMALAVLMQTDDGKPLANIDLRVPVDVAGVLPPGAKLAGSSEREVENVEPMVGVTFGVHDVDRAAATLPSGWVARPWRAGLRVLGDGGVVCETDRRGHVPARVFCASSEEGARLLGGWMTRTLVAEPPPPVDVHTRLFAAPVRAAIHAMIDDDLREGIAGSRDVLASIGVTDPDLIAVPGIIVDEIEAFAEDSDQLDLDIDLDPATKTATMKLVARFRSNTAWATRVLADPAERRGPPPAIFWRAPKDADSASWSMSASPRHFAGIRRVVDKAIRAATSQLSLKPDESAALVAAVNGIPDTPGAWFTSQGDIPWKAPPKGNVTPQNAVADFKDRMRSYVGWGVIGVDAPPKPWIDWCVQLDAAWKKGLVAAKRELPDGEALDALPRVKLVRNPGGYPAGSIALDFQWDADSETAWSMSPRLPAPVDGAQPEHPAGKPFKSTMSARFVVVPDGGQTLMGWSLDDAMLRAHIKASLRDAPPSGTIAARTDIARLKREGTDGGYVTLSSWTDMLSQLAIEDDPELAEIAHAFARLPNKAATPILTFADGTTGTTPTITLELLIQEGTIEDVRALTQIAMAKGIDTFIKGGTAVEAVPAPVVPVPPPAVAPSPARP
jgi:hypothetical protein